VEEHQAFQSKLSDIQQQIREKDAVVRDLALQLRQLEKKLEETVENGKKRLEIMEQAKQGKL
jgi:hypothetical protein